MSGPLSKGALVAYQPTTAISRPVITAFQFNPEKMVHTWSQAGPAGNPGVEAGNPMAVAGLPGETFQLTILLDANDDITGPQAPLAQAAQDHGVSGRLAALEMLLYPVASARAQAAAPTPGSAASVAPQGAADGGLSAAAQSTGGLVGTVSAAASSTGAAARTWAVPNSMVPIVLFVWGPKRVLPVRVTTLTITETLYDAQLNPTHAEATLALRVLTPAELYAARPDAGTTAETAQTAYEQTLGLRRQWAATNAANAPSSITGMLPQ
jgi:hypothetical protein